MLTLRLVDDPETCQLACFDARDPRISPALADVDRFPRVRLPITAGYDSLAQNSEKLARRLGGDAGRRVFIGGWISVISG
jgi:hypothetical protein